MTCCVTTLPLLGIEDLPDDPKSLLRPMGRCTRQAGLPATLKLDARLHPIHTGIQPCRPVFSAARYPSPQDLQRRAARALIAEGQRQENPNKMVLLVPSVTDATV